MMSFSVENANAYVVCRKDALRTHQVNVQKKTEKQQTRRGSK